jgi:hypothetical protein
MKHHGFSAREAIGWLRIVRPGSVIGRQQQFLCEKEELMHEAGEAYRARRKNIASESAPPEPAPSSTAPADGCESEAEGPWGLEAVQRAVAEAVHAVDLRGWPAGSSSSSLFSRSLQGAHRWRSGDVKEERPEPAEDAATPLAPAGAKGVAAEAKGAAAAAAHVTAAAGRRNLLRGGASMPNLLPSHTG